jgi:hypothetical protein
MELSELTNRELKNILRQNNIKNYSKLNKKELVKKVNKLIKVKNGGNQNKKYTFKNLVGGTKEPSTEPSTESSIESSTELSTQPSTAPSTSSSLNTTFSGLKNKLSKGINTAMTNSDLKNKLSKGINPAITNKSETTSNPQPSAPPLNAVNENKLSNQEFNRQTELAKEQSLKNNPNSTQNPNTNPKKEECGPCSIL